jgi:formamidopyrimidine-DNA glycosylase
MPPAHRNGDKRRCGASTIVEGQGNVYVNGQLWAVKDDPNSHKEGRLINSGTTVFINQKNVIVHAPDRARSDLQDHTPTETRTAQGSDDVYCYGS